jgi:hypothetical protein
MEGHLPEPGSMNPLVRQILVVLTAQPFVSSVRILQLDETPSGHLEVKIRCRIANEQHLQIWLSQRATTLDYAYQLFTSVPLLRWDNAPHYPNVSSAPHHFHDEYNLVSSSPLTGNPAVDLPIVLEAIGMWLDQRTESS